jgi:N-acyl-D-amino-acid deacylase
MTVDLLIRGALVYPGDGPPSVADVAVADGRIEAVETSLGDIEAADVLDAHGLMLSPGFVDMHAHSALRSFDEPLLEPKIAQGFTTELINPDGLAPAPVAPDRRGDRQAYLRGLEGSGPEEWPWSTFPEYLDALADSRPTTTLVPSIGHNSVRDAVMGGERRAPTAGELRRMQDEVRLGLEAGARTLSFGLLYLPGAYADTDELIALAEVAAEFGAPLVPHVRNEGREVLGAVGEFIEVARRSGAPLHVSHLKSAADEALIDPLLELLDEASADVDLSFDQYPYGAGSTVLSALLPAWAQEGGASATLGRLRRSEDRRRIAQDMEHGLPTWENWFGMVGPERIVVANAAPPNESAAGRTLSVLAAERDVEPVELVFDLLTESELDVTMLQHYASDGAVRRIAAHRLQLVGSDAIFGVKPHPRLYGTAARFLGRFTIREGLVPVEEAVARLTSRAAGRLGLRDRGRIANGLRADLVLVDPESLCDTATYEEPRRYPDGVVSVWIAGRAVWRAGRATGERTGGVVKEARG